MKAAKALKEKGETPEELLRSIKENEAAVAEAQREVDAWKAIVVEKARREEAAKAEAERIATEKAEAERKAAEERERAEKEEKVRIEAEKKEAERIAAEKAEEEARVEAERKAEEERKTKEEERNERDENGQPFVVSSDGTTTFGEITEDTGLTVAPIKLSEGVADEKGNGYGLRHIEARHGDQIRKAGFSSVEEFIEQVAKNYDVIKEGSDRNGNKTYRLLLTDKHNNTLMIELSKDGSYWNVNTAGVFKKSYGKDKKEVYNRHTTVKQSAETAETSQADEHSGTQSTSRMNVPTTSADKGTTLPADQQSSDKENTKKVADSEGENTLKAKIEAASADVNTEPTEAQKEAGNYKKGHVQVGTFDITIEQPEGSIRRGTDADGKQWEIKMHNTYGYFRGTEGVDGDHIDVFLSNDIDGWNGRKVFVVDQYNPDGTFDEHKVMLGFNDMDEAKSDYLANYEKGWENGRRITVSTTNLEDFEKWIDSSHRKTKPFSEYSSVNKETVATDKGGEKAEKKQKKQSVFDKAKEIADKEEKKRKAEAEADSVLGQATRAVGKKKKVNLFKYTVSEKNSIPVLRGVHYANGYAYASDGYILFKEKADYPKEWEGTTRDKNGNLIDGKYPDTEKAIHRLVHIPDKEVESLPSKEVLDFAIAAGKKLKRETIPVAVDGIFFNAVNLKRFLEAVASKGMDKVVYRHPMLYATNGKDEIVLMPTVNTLEGALDIADRMESAGFPKEQIDAWKAHIEAADKKMSFDDFKKAVENAKKEGVRHTEAEKPKEQPLTEAERKDAEEIAGALGYRVEWVDTMEENGTIDADKKVIRIAKDAENPLVQVLGHEVAHGVKRMDGGKFKALQKAAMEVVGEKEWNERIEKKRKLNAYAEGKLAEEVTCDIVGEALNDKDALKRLAESLRGERGILARLRDAVVGMVEYFKNRGDKDGVRRMKAADKLLAEFEGALKEGVAPEQVKPEGIERSVRESRSEKTELTAEERELRDNLVERMRKGGLDVVTDSEEMQRVIDTENERTRNMFVGEKGATEADKAEEVSTRLDNLSVARRMEEAKKDAKTIKMATGWERGSDGKWRYETSDIKPKPFEEWMNKKNLKLGDIIDSDSGLFEMYPELKDFKVTRGKGKSTNAAIYTGLGKIEINFSKFKPYMSIPSNREKINGILHRVINHEIQHAIQDSEGFAQGVSPNAFRPDAPIGKLREMEEADGRMVERYNAMSYTEKALGEGVRLKERILENRKEYNALASKYRFGMDGYTRAAGEVEARNTEKRIGMTEEERRASLASETEDVAREDQILLGVDNADGEQRFLRTAGGEVYGLVKDGRIYLDPKVATAETAVHEYTHLWGDMLRRKDSEQWSHTVKELKNSVLWEEVKELYPELKTDDEIADEVLSTFSGRRGAERLREEARRVADGDGGVFTKAKAIETLERVKEAIARFWEGVAKMFGINRYRSAEELADMAMRDLLDSKNPMKDESGMRKRGEVGETLATSGTYFSGGGLLEAGLKGVIDPKVAVEFSEKIAGVYADNHGNHIVVADVRDVDPKKLVGAVDGGEVQYFHASPVCKNFSKAKREGGEVELDKETALSTAEFIAKTRPKVVTIENVKGYRNSEALKIITDELTRQGYDWDADVYNAADYGGYTKRERLIVRAKRDGKLPPKPEKLPEELRKKGWYSAEEDLIPHLEEKKTGVPQGTDERLKNSGIDYRTIDKPLYVFGRGYANKTVGHAFADELLPTLTTGGGDIIIMPDGRVLKASPRVLARVTGLPDTYKMPETDQLSHTIVGNGIPTQLTEGVIAPLLDNAIPSAERATKRESVFDVADRVSQNLEERTRAMGSRVEKRMADVAQKLEGKELSMEQKAVVDVFSGEKDNQKFSVERNGVKQQFLLKQGQEDKAGAKHSLYRHYGTNTGVITADDVLKIPQVLERGERIEKAKGGKKMAVYTMDIDGVKYTVLTRVGKNNEIVDDFYSNKKGSESSVYRNVENIDNTPEGARRKDSEPSAKVEDKSESPKLFGEEIIDDGKKGSDSIDRSVRENPKNEDKPRYSRKPGESIFDYASRVSEDVDRSVRERVSARDEYEKKVKSKGFQTKEALQNSMLGLQEFMSAIDHASGNKRHIEDIPDFENPILGENRLSSVNKEEMHQVAKTQFKPLMSAVAKLSGNGKESGELYDYMFAKHGLERDAVMRQREAKKEFDKYQKANPKGTKTIGDFVASLEGKDYAGLTALAAEDGRVKSIQSQIDAIDEQMKATDDQLLLRKLGGQKKRLKVDLLNAARDAADDIRKAFESNPSHDRSDINELWSRVNEVNGNTLRKLYESGMLTKEAYNDISSMYTNYIPMRGFDQTTSADAYAYLTHGDSAFNAPIKTAKGRSSKADNPIAYMQAMAESAIMQGNLLKK